MRLLSIIGVLGIVAFGCHTSSNKKSGDKEKNSGTFFENLQAENFADTIDGKPTGLYFLSNGNGLKAAITNYGGRIVGLSVPDKTGKQVDVVLGFSSVEGYQNSSEPYFGGLIGRVGNRIAKGRFTINGKEYQLPVNNGPNTLHGGIKGFQDVVWDATQPADSTLVLKYFSKDGEEGFPGNLDVKVSYTLTANNELEINYQARTDTLTPVNLTNHAFFNLNGEGSGTIYNHKLWIDADYFTPVDSTLIPTGELRPVENTPFDFRTPALIGAQLDTSANTQLRYGRGYDHNFVLNNQGDKNMPLVAKVQGDISGIVMEIYTNEPGLQFYSGNFMQSQNTFKSGAKDDFRTAFCLETQHFPDAPNHPGFPSIMLDKGKVYKTVSIYRFDTINE